MTRFLLFFGSIVFFIFFTLVSIAKDEKEKDCVYCLKFEKLFDWPVEGRPNGQRR